MEEREKDSSEQDPLQDNDEKNGLVKRSGTFTSPKEESDNEDDSAIPKEIRQILKSETSMTRLMMGMGSGMPADPELAKQQDNHQFEIARKGIDATREDRKETRAHDMTRFKIMALIASGVILALIALSFLAMSNNQTQFVLELIKAVGYAAGGFGGGALVFGRKGK